ncbi:rRNA maturation RNase YbeY [Ilyomonas limi]|uniref:Endoribonuclease YbeY n=1 Tax=Ilyomonas limi TaxID=2575867 RepID=A0A4U3LAK8_9BACT|nr:rRNA maturation RNase YbeY [Ilyomonas limi]TKK71474.1 rRNA maturation RNase YbeY [Ilyomonas limi]
MSAIKFYVIDINPAFTQKIKLKQFIKHIFSIEGKKLDRIDFIFCSDEYLLSLNQQFLQHDYLTDILTFDLSTNNKAITGEVYISIDRIKENAATNNATYLHELKRVIFHGVLHLCGYLDKTSEEKALMTEMENYYLNQFEVFHVETR